MICIHVQLLSVLDFMRVAVLNAGVMCVNVWSCAVCDVVMPACCSAPYPQSVYSFHF